MALTRWLVIAFALLLAAPLMAQKSQPKESLRVLKYPIKIDGCMRTIPSSLLDKTDYRDNMGMYGIKPTFVMMLPEDCTDEYGNIMYGAYREMLQAIDDLARRLGKKADVVAVYYVGINDDPAKPPSHITQTKLKYASLMAFRFAPGEPSNELIDLLFNMDLNSVMGALNWIYMSGLGEIGETGMGQKDPKLEDAVKRVEKRLPPKAEQAAIIDLLNKWNVGEALKLIAKAEKKPKEDEVEWLAQQRALAESMEAEYRRLVADREKDRAFHAEYADALANLSERILRGDDSAKRVAAELAEFRKTNEYKLAIKAKPKFEELRKEYYNIRTAWYVGETEQQYYKKKFEAHKAIKPKLEAFVETFGEIGYAEYVRDWLDDIREAEMRGQQ